MAPLDMKPNELEPYWMPFTPNRAFKKSPRLFAGAKDMHFITPDGRKVYMSAGEHNANNFFHVVDAADGDVIGSVHVAPQTLNAVCNCDSTRAYLSSVTSPYVTVAATSDDHVVRRVGPFGDSVRPFTIDGRAAAFVEGIDGDAGNVIGISLPLLRELLAKLGVQVTDLWR